MNYDFKFSFKKFFDIVSKTTISNIECEVKGYKFFSEGVKNLVLAPSFFRNDECLCCARCCRVGYYLFLTQSDFQYNPKKDIFEEIKIHGNRVFTTYNVSNCPFLNKNICSIQQFKPIHCHFPHFRLRPQGGNKQMLCKTPYSRLWRKRPEDRCPSKFTPYTEEGKHSDILVLEHLIRVQEDLGLNTSLVKNVVDYLSEYLPKDEGQLKLL